MAYRFKINESFGRGVRRIGVDQLRRALQELSGSDRNKAIHETRKAIKRLRALLRLARYAIGHEQFERENLFLRDIARQLSTSRDTAVLIGTVEKLKAASTDDHTVQTLEAARDILTTRAAALHESNSDLRDKAVEALKSCEHTWKSLEIDAGGFEPISQGLARTYRSCRRNYARAHSASATGESRDAVFHEWRKTVQQHWRQMRLMREAWPAYFDLRAESARQLSDLLGEAQDLTLLSENAKSLVEEGLPPKQAVKLSKIARRRQNELRLAAQPLAERLLVEKPKELVRRIGVYWSTAAAVPHEKHHTNGAAAPRDIAEKAPERSRGSARRRTASAKPARAGSSRGS